MEREPASVWDALVERSRLEASTVRSTGNRGLRSVAVRPEAKSLASSRTRRELAEVPQALRDVFRGLVSGQLPWPLYLWGPAGTGKTSAALVLLDHCGPADSPGSWADDVRDWMVGYVEVRHLPRVKIGADQGRFQWSRGGNAGDVSWPMLRRALSASPLVVFDEIGVGRDVSDFRLDTLIEVLNLRADDPVRPFVVTSNLKPSDIERTVYDDRVASRILAGTIFKFDGADRRQPGAA
jgi:predicted ATPase